MRDDQLLKRLPYHSPANTAQVTRLRKRGAVLGVFTNGEEGVNLYPGPIKYA